MGATLIVDDPELAPLLSGNHFTHSEGWKAELVQQRKEVGRSGGMYDPHGGSYPNRSHGSTMVCPLCYSCLNCLDVEICKFRLSINWLKFWTLCLLFKIFKGKSEILLRQFLNSTETVKKDIRQLWVCNTHYNFSYLLSARAISNKVSWMNLAT